MQAFIPYTPEDAFAEKSECEAEARRWIEWARERGWTAEGFSYQTKDGRGYRTEHELRCLPETVDPRRPK